MKAYKAIFSVAIIWVVVFAVYLPTRSFEFLNFDDNEYITENSHVNTGLTKENIIWAFTSEHGAHWHPLSWISHMVDVELFGVNSGAHHLVNAGIHATNAALLFTLMLITTGSALPSLFVALLFGLHPMRLESVAWVTERKDVLSVFFILLTLISYSFFTRSRKVSPYIFSIITFILSLLAKPTAIILPILLFTFDLWPLKRIELSSIRKTPKGIFLEKIPFFLGALACGVAAIMAQSTGGGLKSFEAYPFDLRIPSVLVGYLAYLGKFFFPSGLGIFYPFVSHQPGVGAGAFIALIVLTSAAFTIGKRYPSILSGWLWFLVSLVPVIGVLQIGGQAFADRWSYVSHIGLLFGLTWAIVESGKLNRISANMFGISVIALATTITVIQLPNWKSSESIFRHTIEVSPDNFMAHMNLGVALDRAGKLEEASKHYDIAVTIRPFYPDALSNLGGARARLGDLSSAENLFKRAIGSSPTFVQAHYNLGLVYWQTGRQGWGVIEWLKALRLNPNFAPARGSVENILRRFSNEGCNVFSSSGLDINSVNEIRSLLVGFPDSNLANRAQGILSCSR